MPRKSAGKTPANFRIDRELLRECREVGDNIKPFPPTLTAIVEAALREWIERNRHAVPARKPPAR